MASSSSVKGFQFTPTGIAGILKANRLQVPPYQREYSWEKDQVEQLYADFTRAKSDNADYFLGTIVTIKRDQAASLEIVDGQQRLTTTALLIMSIRDFLAKLGGDEDTVSSIETDYLTTFDRKRRVRMSKLILNVDDRHFFDELLAGRTPATSRRSHQLLVAAKKLAESHVRTITRPLAEPDQPDILNNWLEFLEHNASVILVEAQDGSQAFKMFETLNDRGLKTSQADLVKSYLFGQSSTRVDECLSKWSSIKDNLEALSDDDREIAFLRHALIASRQFLRTAEIYDFCQRNVRGESNAVAFISELERLSRSYVATFSHSASHWVPYSATARRALEAFNRFNIKPARPLILAAAATLTPQLFERVMSLVLSLSVRLVVAGSTRSETNERAFATTASAITKGELTTFAQIKESLKPIIVGDQEFRDAFSRLRVSKAELARYYLRALEAKNADDSEPWYVANDDPTAMTLEHVLPQNPQGVASPTDVEMHARSYKLLGNVCILNRSANSDLGNMDFEAKSKALKNSPYALTAEIAKNSQWTISEIEKRQRRLAELAVKTWPA